ncbi:TIGR01777 family oxidoreductase [Hoyosella subflava]|uniref:TIGR01777 family protein n=1 Tax=Hoyosella subflava (strain DSM 45089 / JCM 17490 / NBRC 109087 / DQS3-9A1) TaxID=443218 RepID=F6EEL6_HOYSD|nr:TIGR01777 family oxidoreductase [Hoyosella subflava]AEF39713.1 hypothetical protein AS9A_1261 [Hoyosella subflava DQS3-9A1]
MRVMIAGSSGLTGTALVEALRADGHTAIRLVRRQPTGSDEVSWDPGRALDPSVLDGCDAVVNLCGASLGDKRWTGAYKQELRDSRIEPTEVLAEAAAKAGVPVMISASAVGYYGDTGDKEADESAPPGEGFLATLCQDWEKASAPAERAGVRVANIRTGLVLAPKGGILTRLQPIYRFALGGRLGDGRQYFPWISLTDHVRAMMFLISNSEMSGPVNLTGPAPVTNAEFNTAMARAIRRPAPWVVPGFMLKLIVGEFAEEAILAGQRAIPAKLERAGFSFEHSTIREALDAVFDSGGS